VKSEYPNKDITIIGHSLGGTVAQAVGAETGVITVTFNTYGAGKAITDPQNTNNITNYGNAKDPIFMSNINNQIGKTYVITDSESNNGVIISGNRTQKDYNLDNHYIDNMGDISKSIEYNKDIATGDNVLKARREYDDFKHPYTTQEIAKMTPKEFKANEAEIYSQMKDGLIQSNKKLSSKDLVNYNNPELNSYKIFTREEIGNMSSGEFQKNEKAIDYQLQTIGIPTKSQLDTKKRSGSPKSGSASDSDDEHWVTINGNHVLLQN
jgi:hypothetical protein